VLKTFILGLENLLSLKVKVIRCDNGTEFKNSALNQFCGLKGIKREFSVPKTPQQNGIAERKNRTLIEAARTLLADSLLPILFWAEAETLHVNFMESKPNVAGSGPARLFDIDSITRTMNYHSVIAENQTNSHASLQDTEKAEEEGTHTYVLFPVFFNGSINSQNKNKNALVDGKEQDDDIQKSVSPCIHSSSSGDQTRKQEFEECTNNSSNGVNAASSSVSTARHNFINSTNEFSAAGPSNTAVSPTVANSSSEDASTSSHDSDMPNLEDL
nr:putative ribonuclease H-like domain-containing protein [Tanacetum cinerariifolium]